MNKKQSRQQYITDMLTRGERPNARVLAETFHVHENTIRNDLRTLNERSQVGNKSVVAEMIGRTSNKYGVLSLWNQLGTITVDHTRADYAFYDKLRRGKAPGYELGGLFAESIARILTAWVFGTGPKLHTEGNEALELAFVTFMKANALTLTDWFYESLTLGDSYLAVNPDGTLTLISPNQVEKMVDDLDYRTVTGYKVVTKTEKASITDEYTTTGRTITVRTANQAAQTLTFPNLTGRLPIVHLANERGANEVYGHPTYEALLKLFAEYDDVLKKSLDGVKVMGHPIPVVEGLEDPQATLELNSTDDETWTDANGTPRTRPVIDFTKLSMLFLGSGGTFKFASPGAFTQDAGRLLEYLFLLMLQRSGIPEWTWGGAIASSKASVDAQMPAFSRTIEGLRMKLEVALLELVRVWLATIALSDPRYNVADDTEIDVQWPELSTRDESITQNWAKLALGEGALTRESLLMVADLPGIVPSDEIEAADQEAQERQDAFGARIDTELNTPPDNVTDLPTDENQPMEAAA